MLGAVVVDVVVVLVVLIVVVVDPAPASYVTCNTGATAASVSYDSAIRAFDFDWVSPVIRIASAFPACQSLRLTIAWINGVRSSVCCAEPAAPRMSQSGGVHATAAPVGCRPDISKSPSVKGGASPMSSATSVSVVGPVPVSSTVN